MGARQPEEIILIGGGGDSNRTGETVKGGTEVTLQNGGHATCALAWEDGFVTIGGSQLPNAHGKVDWYDSEGKYLGSLPDLETPRMHHTCTTFISYDEQVLLVAGGERNGIKLTSTELFFPSINRWTTRENLPRALKGLRAARLNQQVDLTGGRDNAGNNIEVLQFDVASQTWTQIGTLQDGRNMHAIAEVNLNIVCSVGTDGGAHGGKDEVTDGVTDGGAHGGKDGVTDGGASAKSEKLERMIVEHIEEQKRFIAEQFEEQKRFIAEQFDKYFD